MTTFAPTPVRCSAIVDPANADADKVLRWGVTWGRPSLGPNPLWRVTVWGQPPHSWERLWLIEAKDDTEAAHEGLRRFVAEAERPSWMTLAL